MSTEQTQLAERPQSIRDCLASPVYQNRFKEVLRDRAPQFMSALITLSADRNIAECEPRSVIGAAMIAATLDLPIEKSLGQAHIVPYGGKAQFQLGYKAYIQLAHRSGQYARLNARPVNAEAMKGFDEVGEPIIDWAALDDTIPAIGYVFAFKLINGFTKICYWPKSKVEAHASKFSQAYKRKKMDSPWFTNFDAMALKTVIMNELRQWGVLSVQMQSAMKHDMGVVKDIGEDPEYIDNQDGQQSSDQATDVTPQRPSPPARSKKGIAAVVEVPAETVPPTEAETKTAAVIETVATVVEPAKPVEKVAPTVEEVVPAKVEAPAPVVERAFLKDGESFDAIVKVVEVGTLIVNLQKVPHPSVQAAVRGQFTGSVLHVGGAQADGDKLTPHPLWRAGNTVRLKLLGKLNKASGKVLARVEGITAEATGPDSVDVE